MTENRKLRIVILFIGIAIVFSVRAVSAAVEGEEFWRGVYSFMSLAAWVYAAWGTTRD